MVNSTSVQHQGEVRRQVDMSNELTQFLGFDYDEDPILGQANTRFVRETEIAVTVQVKELDKISTIPFTTLRAFLITDSKSKANNPLFISESITGAHDFGSTKDGPLLLFRVEDQREKLQGFSV